MRFFLTFVLLIVGAFPLIGQTLKPIKIQNLDDISVAVGATDRLIDLRSYFDLDGVTGTIVRFDTVLGLINVELFDQQVPITVANFLGYVGRNDYDRTFFHRVVPNFVVQGGGFYAKAESTPLVTDVPALSPIVLEDFLSNTRGTMAMARTSDLESATSQFFFNTVDNSSSLDKGTERGYAVFGRVIGDSINVVSALGQIQTANFGSPFEELPLINNPDVNDLKENNFVVVRSVREIPVYPSAGEDASALIFSAFSSNPSLVSASVENSGLVLGFDDSAEGVTTITVRCDDSDGNRVTAQFQVTIGPILPLITGQPLGRAVKTGEPVTLDVAVESSLELTYSWRHNGQILIGETDSVLSIDAVDSADAGAYDVVVSSASGSVTSSQAFLRVTDEFGYLTNLSTRAVTSEDFPYVWTTPGFVVRGSGEARILSRAVGPGLERFGVTGVVPDTLVSLSPLGDPSNLIASNDDWGGSDDLQALVDATQQAGAFAFEAGSGDSALVASVGQGSYTANAYSKDGATIGVVLGEIYLLGEPTPEAATLVNLSNRGHVGSLVEVMIGGLVVAGDGPVNLMIRGVGPTLSDFGVSGILEDPTLAVRDSLDNLVAENDDWGDGSLGSTLAGIAATVGAFPLTADSSDAALLVVLDPGVYTVILSGQDSGTGTGLLEFYLVD